MARYIRTVYTDTAGIRRKYETKKAIGTHLILMELMMVLFFFCNLWINSCIQVFVKAHNIKCKSKRNEQRQKIM